MMHKLGACKMSQKYINQKSKLLPTHLKDDSKLDCKIEYLNLYFHNTLKINKTPVENHNLCVLTLILRMDTLGGEKTKFVKPKQHTVKKLCYLCCSVQIAD